MDTPPVKKVSIIRRTIEVCPHCGAWNSFRKGRNGKTRVDRTTGRSRIYGKCRNCGARLVVMYVAAPERPE